jgi:2-dehydropantoate 2-reductase
MRILILGAGATGGYFGGRMLEAGADVTFLVRPRRAEQLRANGLVVESPLGDIRRPAPVVTAEELRPEWDVVVLSCKAWDLVDAIGAMTPAVGPETKVLPLLNGLVHLDVLDEVFGADRVLGGLCQIAATLTPDGVVRHLAKMHVLAFGHRSMEQRRFCAQLDQALGGVAFTLRRSEQIVLEMWEKWVLLATLAGATCGMRATIGDIVGTKGGDWLIRTMLAEANAIATANGNATRANVLERTGSLLTEAGSTLAASMLRDVEAGGPIEVDHILGDLLRRGQEKGVAAPLLTVAYLHLKSYEARRAREAGQGTA